MGERAFGPYRLVQQIAVGGMAEIHLAKTRGIAGFEKYVALKMIHPNFSSDEQFIQMLIDEAKITVQLQHVNIAQTFDLGRVGETYYITMEFVDGADLYQLLRRGSERGMDMPVEVAAYVAKEMATGLDYAHRKRDMSGRPLGIVHRDVSPQNVLISHAGEVKLVDFGIAKATMRVRQTAVGVIKGKYYYMSPEQAWGDSVDHRTDVFSAGIVLYEMLTGQMLYLEEDLHKLLDMVRKADIAPPTTLRRDIPPQLERIVMHALAKRAEDRYQTAADLATDLERFLHVYSPVFTAAKVVRYCRSVLGDPAPPPVSAPVPVPTPEPRSPSQNTMRVTRDQLVRERSEFTDENSVIFRIAELAQRPRSQSFAEEERGSATAPDPMARPARAPDQGTMPIAGVDDGEERTVISGPPGFGGGIVDAGSADSAITGDHDFEPTVVGGSPADDDDLPTMTATQPLRERDPRAAGVDDEETRAELPRGARPAPRTDPHAVPRHPALSASTPQPAVSELRQPRRSRRTPPEGSAGQSILAAIVQSAGPADPSPTRPLRSGAPSDGVPHLFESGPEPVPMYQSEGASGPTQPWPGAQPPPVPSPAPAWDEAPAGLPGHHPVPNRAGTAGGFPLVAPKQTPNPFVPVPLPVQPSAPSLTKQLVALEVDEIPSVYKIRRGTGPRWLLRAGLALGGFVIGVLVVMGIFSGEPEAARASIMIESIPTGATVTIDGQKLPETTPTIWREARPGARYTLELTLVGFKPWTKEILVRDSGGEVSTVAFLKRRVVSLTVESEPAGAEVYVAARRKGVTPLSLSDLDPEEITEVELRLPGYAISREALAWDDQDQKTIRVRLRKQ